MFDVSRFSKSAAGQYGGHITCPEGYLLGLWMHECRRVFCDKLVTQTDKDWVEDTITGLCQGNVDAKLAAEVDKAKFAASALYYIRVGV